ncbi:unnamed protein product [Adineta steineri]|uniref:SCP domain-containing protein n=1 Tax=Adineta steineri TaxID=433720 RepID=A0A813NM40_9BILA|nr:unnamed protein product [Adineta steineri]CAF1246952.1 unnamed protein product [Adineta steineri]
MGLTGTQIGLCFQSYWYMWLTNALAGLVFIGINIGVAGFFLKKFIAKKQAHYAEPPTVQEETARRPFSASEISTHDDGAMSRASSRKSRTYFILNKQSFFYIFCIVAMYPGASEDNDEFAESTLKALNAFRRRHTAEPLGVNEQLCEIAQRWAEQMARTGKLEHSPAEMRNLGRQTLGENFSASFQSELTGEKMVRKWMKEGKRYMFGFDGRKDTENFTQSVWQASREIGVGRARSEDGNWWYGVVVFDPPGNIPNQYSNNVFLPADKA